MPRLNRPLRRTGDADPDDVLGVKFAFHDLGYYDPPTGEFHPWPDAPLFEAIESFQVDNDLDRDGEMLPGGPTEAVLNSLPAAGSAPAPNAYERAVAEGRVRTEDAIPDSESWLDARRRQLGADVGPAAYRQSRDHRGDSGDIMVPRNPFAGGGGGYAGLGAALAGAAMSSKPGEVLSQLERRGASSLRRAPSLLESAPAPAASDDARAIPSLMEAEGWHRAAPFEALPPQKTEPLRGPSAEEIDRLNKEMARPTIFPAADPIVVRPEDFPAELPSFPQIFIFPDQSDEIPQQIILESRWGKDKTQAEVRELNKRILDQHKDWKLRGGVPYGKEYWFPGPGSAFGDKEGKRGDGRPGGRWGDLVYELPDGRLVVFQHADVDVDGKIEQHELDAARAMIRPGVTVYIVPKQWQLERNRLKAENRENRQSK